MVSEFNPQNLAPIQRKLRRQLLHSIYSADVAHIGSCLSSLDIIWSIYQHKSKDDVFVLSNGHAGFAWYTVLSELSYIPFEIIPTLDVHPHRHMSDHISVSTGSLGQGLPIAIGLALADSKRQIYCLISDGECSEGSIWESFRMIRQLCITNLTVLVSANGWSAYDKVDTEQLYEQIKGFGLYTYRIDGHNLEQLQTNFHKTTGMNNPVCFFCNTNSNQLPFFEGLQSHYQKLNEAQFQEAQIWFSEHEVQN